MVAVLDSPLSAGACHLTRACSRQARTGAGLHVGGTLRWRRKGNEGLCGHGLEGLQLMRMPLGGLAIEFQEAPT
jgi:hypothetical protein